MRKPGRILSVIGLIVSAVLLVAGSYFIAPRSRSWASIWSILAGSVTAGFAYYAFHGKGDD